jgi:aldose sugar dehydrogenase
LWGDTPRTATRDTENGEDKFDEINLVEPGFNSGWTAIQGLAKNHQNFNSSELADTLSKKSIIRGVYSDPEFSWNLLSELQI